MSKIGDEVENAINELASAVEEEYYGVGTASTTVGGISCDPHTISSSGTTLLPNDTTTVNPYWGQSGNDIVFSGDGSYDNSTVISIGPLAISATPDGEVEVVLENEDFREEYHFSAKTMRELLRKLADVVVEGKET